MTNSQSNRHRAQCCNCKYCTGFLVNGLLKPFCTKKKKALYNLGVYTDCADFEEKEGNPGAFNR